MNVCHVVQFIDTEKPERTERMFTVAHDTMIFLQKQLHMCEEELSKLGVDRYVFFRADTDTDYYRSSRPITDILNRYTCLV